MKIEGKSLRERARAKEEGRKRDNTGKWYWSNYIVIMYKYKYVKTNPIIMYNHNGTIKI